MAGAADAGLEISTAVHSFIHSFIRPFLLFSLSLSFLRGASWNVFSRHCRRGRANNRVGVLSAGMLPKLKMASLGQRKLAKRHSWFLVQYCWSLSIHGRGIS
ncbi:hypothetical protein LY76DRAFT_586168 [Colletotrichum caudatum]|nr:hypothetical protein LY76DRAFT_586168 [Colletotrichum caudatum]